MEKNAHHSVAKAQAEIASTVHTTAALWLTPQPHNREDPGSTPGSDKAFQSRVSPTAQCMFRLIKHCNLSLGVNSELSVCVCWLECLLPCDGLETWVFSLPLLYMCWD